MASEKISVTIRLDKDIIDGFKALADATPGGKYQALINQALKEYLERDKKKGDVETRLARIEKMLLKKI